MAGLPDKDEVPRRRRLRVLFLCTRLPAPPRRGDQVRSFHLLRELAVRHDITCIATLLRRPSAEEIALSRALGIKLIVHMVTPTDLIAALAKAPFENTPLETLAFAGRRARLAAHAMQRGQSFDLVHAQLARTAGLVHPDGPPLVVDLIDALSANLRRRAELTGGLLGPLLRIEASRLLQTEQALLRQAAAGIVVGPDDRAALGMDSIHVIPNGVDLAAFEWREGPRRADEIVFAGNLGYFPNVDAACRLARRILPAIQLERPAVGLRLVGARPSRSVRALTSLAGVMLAANVPVIADEIARAAISVIPMRAGSGMQNKILEAMAVGTPVVTTSAAAEACGARPDTEVLVADDDAGLARAALLLLRDPARARTLARAARAHVERQHSWAAAAVAVEDLWLRAAAGNLALKPSID